MPPDKSYEHNDGHEDVTYWPPVEGWRDHLQELPQSTDISILDSDGSITICLKPKIGWRVTCTLFGTLSALLTAIWLIVFLVLDPSPAGKRWNIGVQGFAIGISLIPCFICFAIYLFTWMLRETLVVDEYGLQINETSHGIFVANSQFLSVRPVLRSRREAVMDLSPPRWWPFTRGETGYLDIVTIDGVLRLLGRWDMADIRWVSHSLSIFMAAPKEIELDVSDRSRDECNQSRTVLITDRPDRGIRYSLTFFLMFFGIFFGGIGYWHLPSGIATYSWLRTDGIVRHVDLNVTGTGLDRNSDVEIEYDYEVGGRQYRGDRIWFAMRSNAWQIEDLANAHPSGSTIDVFYDPSNPNRSVLLQGVDPISYFLVLTPLFFVLIAWLLWRIRLMPDQENLRKRYIR